ncbi:AnkB protein [Vibrio ichthyoenteri ATCC 700023]|uniref:AnkB protein n=1 Tax=Vibrio ichthyoenteri ATCC 700023 TaxID=870968 RepID=F9S3T2_9VIBR|nr:ankyrin repeat domain-containing protein [Vibrio ichthyoenteri]EGU37728.1 AnkB protein [Vibrio ichthyoenteri ATCC 700023]
MKKITKISSFIFLLSMYLVLMASEQKFEEEYQAIVELYFDAARIGNNEVIDMFLSEGFPVDQRNQQSYTALMVAAYQGNQETVRLLLASGSNPCLQDKRGNTALMGALIKREISIAKDLYVSECSSEIRNKAGLNLHEFAKIFGQSDVLKDLAKK